MESKITRFGLVSLEKSKIEVRRGKLIVKIEKMIKFYKLKLVYELKLKSNVIG